MVRLHHAGPHVLCPCQKAMAAIIVFQVKGITIGSDKSGGNAQNAPGYKMLHSLGRKGTLGSEPVIQKLSQCYKTKKNQTEKKDTVNQFNSQISSAEKIVSECAQNLSRGYEMRSIECEITTDFAKNKVTLKRLDTGEIFEERAMTAGERQLELGVN